MVCLGADIFAHESPCGTVGSRDAAMPVAVQRHYSRIIDRGANSHRRTLPGLLLRRIHDVHWPDHGRVGDAVCVWAGGVLSLCRALETAPSSPDQTGVRQPIILERGSAPMRAASGGD